MTRLLQTPAVRARFMPVVVLAVALVGAASVGVEAGHLKGRSAHWHEGVYARVPHPFPDYPVEPLTASIGEVLHFEFGWNGIPASKGWVQIHEDHLMGRPMYRMRAEAWTIGLADAIWPMRDWVEATAERETFEPHTFTISRREGGYTSFRHTTFRRRDWAACTIKLPRPCKDYWIRTMARDPASLFYTFRAQSLTVGDEYYYEIYEGRDRYLLIMRIDERETIKVKAGEFDAYRITPLIRDLPPEPPKHEDLIESATLWISADRRHIPLKVTSKVFIGKVYGELVKIETIREPLAITRR